MQRTCPIQTYSSEQAAKSACRAFYFGRACTVSSTLRMCYGPLSARLTSCVPSAPIRRAIVALAADESRVRQAELSLWVTFTSFLPSRCIRFAQQRHSANARIYEYAQCSVHL